MVLKQHKLLWDQVFSMPGFFAGPFLMFGFQEMTYDMYTRKRTRHFKEYLEMQEVEDITVIDWNDKRADVHLDMNNPLPEELEDKKFKVVADIGCLEHVLNTQQCLKNCLSMVEVGGLYLLHTPVMGYYKHGVHTFNPDFLRCVLVHNGFKIMFDKYSTKTGQEIKSPTGDTLIWLVAKKVEEKEFITPIDNHGKFELDKED